MCATFGAFISKYDKDNIKSTFELVCSQEIDNQEQVFAIKCGGIELIRRGTLYIPNIN